MDDNSDYSNEENIRIVEQYFNSYLEENLTSCLYKTAKEYKSDIFDFGSLALKKYVTMQDFENSDWFNNYENSFFKVEVHSTLQFGQLYTKI